ncbi:signal transduction histidine kinase [Rhizomicrobium palustre]|uniref:histidine kinase n=1 Tax=Rhizomicrobium palustre TaxID=189966 RepID=A0A846N2Y6_9PROT|nr:ATP-binding protein [Rhizomicrobium palustre]NIK89651.1 signal transduction histidine kinase [Rhizomicrobium palustre]
MRLSLRLALILGVTLTLLLSVLLLAFIVAQRPARAFGVVLPRPAQVAAMAELIETTPQQHWDLAITAISTPYTKLQVLEQPPQSAGGRPMPGIVLALRRYQRAVGDRPVSVMAELEQDSAAPDIELRDDQVRATRPVRILLGLHNGKLLMIEARRPLSERFTGLKLGFLALGVTIVIGLIALWVIRRQLKPLERLGAAVEKFGTRLEVSLLPEKGSLELRQLIAAFNRLQANIGELVKGRTRIITAVGHDLGTYLTRLRLRVEYIGDNSQREKAISDIEDMQALMQETIALAKLEHDGQADGAIDLAALLPKIAERFGEGASYDVPADHLWVRAAGIERAIGNLVSNALKYGHEAHLAAAANGDEIHIVVEDRGPGIPLGERAAVLEPFYRLDSARNLNERGFGLGLAIVAEVVKAASGKLLFEDREGGGLRVRMIFPNAQA